MESVKFVGFDDGQYRNEVLLFQSEEAEISQQQKLIEEACQLGLKVPEIEAVASLAASIASGMVDLSSSILSSGSSTDRISVCEGTPSHETHLDQAASSLSEFTLSSDRAKCGSTRSIASLSTRPTSYSSSEGRVVHGLDTLAGRSAGQRHSFLSATSSEKKERRKSSLKSAIGKIQFRKKRSPSTVLLPSAAQIRVTKVEGGDTVYVKPKTNETHKLDSADEVNKVLKLEIPVFDNESLQRSLNNAELQQMRESHKIERNRHIAFQNDIMRELRRKQQDAVADRLAQNRKLEDQKREKNSADTIRMEERQLAVEIEQVREFERAKMNSRTRIKHMEGYFSNTSPPPSPPDGSTPTSPDILPSPSPSQTRQFTAQNKAQLAQEYRAHDSMDQLHEAKIKVLRDRQEVRLQEAIARMERELDALIDKHAMEFSQLQSEHQREELSTIQAFDARKTKLRHRWNLEEAILRKKLEMQHGQLYGPLPPLSFSDSHYDTRDSAICVTDQTEGSSGDEDGAYQKRDGPVL
ncbi:hypothetical protein EYZ11_008759 [Aspergillus tanneri]|uniref:Uncharacterized protein n=1 Tax=Aspergillus tanneri TaxID=1220188 RepID=A0A4S3JF49_9EURO|nr:uncharacterized protein ATNIH1004_007225 [Aspergillus tanneri]KAA8645805.1 hypothetical protein ATNIH1004_007225 [Aspergillus tanneri]THC91781.1 hypothetical protein EYZ11_008759 [Aspergillus tanneri]